MEYRTCGNRGWLILERRLSVSKRSESVLAESGIGLCLYDISGRYKGIEGCPWPGLEKTQNVSLVCGVAPADQYELVLEYYRCTCADIKCDMIYIIQGSYDIPSLPSGFTFCGYDYGYYSSEYDSYSVVWNEVLFGRHQSLRDFGGMLNMHLLIPTVELVDKLALVRGELVRAGADLEVDEPSYPIAVYCRVSTQIITRS